jgi:hypothetical protein
MRIEHWPARSPTNFSKRLPGGTREAVQFCGRVEQPELLLRCPLQVISQGWDVFTIPDLLGVAVLEGPDHDPMLTHGDTIDKRKI